MGTFEHYALPGGCAGDCPCEDDLFTGAPAGHLQVAAALGS